MSDLSATALREAADFVGLPEPIDYVRETGSTNDDMKEQAARGAPHGSALVAGAQTAGRGRLGRHWSSPPGDNLYLSVLLRPAFPPRRATLVALAAGVAIVEACRADLRLKWPNDALSPDGRKVAGVLSEMETAGDRLSWVVVGIGINVRSAPPDLPAASLHDLGVRPDRADLAARLVRAVLAEVDRVDRAPGDVLDRWRAFSHTLGRRVTVGDVTGRTIDIDETGALLVEGPGGQRHRVVAGDVALVGG